MIKPKSRSGRPAKYRTVKSHVEFARLNTKGRKDAFIACIRLGSTVRVHDGAHACGFGGNPREALSAAFRKMAKGAKSRRGAFAGRKSR